MFPKNLLPSQIEVQRPPQIESEDELSDRPHFPSISTEHPQEQPEPDEISITSVPIRSRIVSYMTNRSDSDLSVFEAYPGTERTDFDFVNERCNYYTTNLVQSTAHMIKGCLGIGLLCMHEAYMWGGIWSSFGITAILGVLAIHNTLILVRIAQRLYVQLRVPKMSYPDLVEAVMSTGPRWARKSSKWFRIFMEILLFVQIASTCNIYQIMMALTFKRVMTEMVQWDLGLEINILLVTVPIVLLSCIRKFKYLAYYSIFADIFIITCVLSALGYSRLENVDLSSRSSFKSVQGCFKFSGVLLYSIEGTTLALPIENHMRDPLLFSNVVWFAIPLVIFWTTVVGFVGYWRYGEKCKSPMNLHLPVGETFPSVLQFILTIILALTFAINFWIPFKILWRHIGAKIHNRRIFWETFSRISLVAMLTIFSLLGNNLMKFMSFIGNVFLSTVTIIFPAFLDILYICRPRSSSIYLLQKSFKEKVQIFRDSVYIAIGFTLMCGGFYSTYCKPN